MRVGHITFVIDSLLEDVPLLGTVVNTVCSTFGFPADGCSQMEVCVAEAVNNAIKHAYGNEGNHRVELEITGLDDKLVLEVFDAGKSADSNWMNSDHSSALEVDIDHPERVAESGRGIAIMQAIMDSVEYTPGEKRNRLRLTKRLPRAVRNVQAND